MTQIDRISILLPSFNPSDQLLEVVRQVIGQGFRDLIIVDDGSAEKRLFDEAAGIEGCTICRHEQNQGKGAALKTGMAYFLENRPEGIGVITIDDDGQHLPEDIRKCAEAMAESQSLILGVRDFSRKDVPLKSRIGNRLVCAAFRIGIGLPISDTQTGLRAIPAKYIPSMLAVEGSRFEYETNMLFAVKREGMAIREVPIRTVYISGNQGTHFRAIQDSLIILLQFVKYTFGSLLSSGVDLLMFYLLTRWAPFPVSYRSTVWISTLAARGISSVFNFLYNKNFVFAYKGSDTGRRALRYGALCLAVVALSGAFVALAARFIANPLVLTIIKMAVDGTLFLLNYTIQRRWVYKP